MQINQILRFIFNFFLAHFSNFVVLALSKYTDWWSIGRSKCDRNLPRYSVKITLGGQLAACSLQNTQSSIESFVL